MLEENGKSIEETVADKKTKKQQMSNVEMNRILDNFSGRMEESRDEAAEHAGAINSLGEGMDEMREGMASMLKAINQVTSFNTNRLESGELEEEGASMRPAEFEGDEWGIPRDDEPLILTRTTLGATQIRLFVEHQAELDFLEEPVVVHIHTTNEKFAQVVFSIEVNGDKEIFIRGKRKVVARKFIAGLARARPIHYENEEYTNSKGDRAARYNPHRGLRFQFSVERDDNPKGGPWLKDLLRADAA